MRVLVWPLVTSPRNVSSDSGYTYVRTLLRRADFGHWYIVLPDWGADHGVIRDDLDDNPRITKVFMPMMQGFREEESVAAQDVIWRFGPQQGTSPVDVALSMSPMRTLNLANAWVIREGTLWRPLIVNYDLMARDDTGEAWTTEEVELMHHAAGVWSADLNLFQSPMAQRRAMRNVKKYLSPAAIRKVIASGVTILSGADIDLMTRGTAGIEKRPRFAVYYGGRVNPGKGTVALGEVVDTLFRFGREVDFVICTGSLGGFKELEVKARFPEVELNKGMTQEGAWKVQASCHAAICFSRVEMVGLGYWEAMAAGLPVLMKRGPWNEELLPSDYPWFFDSYLEAVAMLRGMYLEWKAGPAKWVHEMAHTMERWAAFASEKFDTEVNQRQMLEALQAGYLEKQEAQFERYRRGTRSTIVEMVGNALKDGIRWQELIDAVRAQAEKPYVVGSRLDWARSHAVIEVYRTALFLGWEDVETEPEPVFVKP